MRNPSFVALVISVAATILEGELAGKGARQRLAELRMPPYSPSFPLWIGIGFLFYAMCVVILRNILTTGLLSHSHIFELVLTILLLLVNGFWNVLFFVGATCALASSGS